MDISHAGEEGWMGALGEYSNVALSESVEKRMEYENEVCCIYCLGLRVMRREKDSTRMFLSITVSIQ